MVAQWKHINENYKNLEGYKRVAWPPASEERVVREFTPQPHAQYSAPAYNPQAQEQQQPPQSQQYQPTAAAVAATLPPTQHQYQPPKQYSPQPQYQGQAPGQIQYQPQQQHSQPSYQQQPWVQENHLPQPYKPPTQQGAYQALQQRQASPYQQQPAYQVPSNNQYQAPHYQQQHQQYQNQYVSQTNQQQQFNSYSQPQQTNGHDQLDHLQQSHDQRGASPGIITLRKEAPISQAPAPVYTSQPAAVSYQGGNKLRGDLKWPPPEYKEAAAVENAERRKLAAGPVCRPRRVARDYTEFFAKNALSHHYPSYKVPPGTQHMIN